MVFRNLGENNIIVDRPCTYLCVKINTVVIDKYILKKTTGKEYIFE